MSRLSLPLLSPSGAQSEAPRPRALTLRMDEDEESGDSGSEAASIVPAPSSDGAVAPTFRSRAAKLAYFSADCTAITEYLYVGGAKVASSESILRAKGITHVINCAGDVCANYFPGSFNYLKLHLLDSAAEDLTAVLYKVLDFIDCVRVAKQRVLLHCQQGVSRSTVLAIAYLMYHQNHDYDAAYEFVRARRGICRPNVGFMCQLLAWRKRVTLASERPLCMYRIGPHNARDTALVTKWVDRVDCGALDSRTVFLLQTRCGDVDEGAPVPDAKGRLFLWVGMLCPRSDEKCSIPYLAHLIAKLQQVEHAGREVLLIRQKGKDKIERAERLRESAQSTRSRGSYSTSPGRLTPGPASFRPSSPAAPARPAPGAVAAASLCAAAVDDPDSFCSEQVSAAFHTLDRAPAILSATSFSCLYPTATPAQASQFYSLLGIEDTEDYSRVGADCAHPISGAILLNTALDEEYPHVPVPDVTLLNELSLRAAGATTPATPSPASSATPRRPSASSRWVVPPIMRSGLPPKPPLTERAATSASMALSLAVAVAEDSLDRPFPTAPASAMASFASGHASERDEGMADASEGEITVLSPSHAVQSPVTLQLPRSRFATAPMPFPSVASDHAGHPVGLTLTHHVSIPQQDSPPASTRGRRKPTLDLTGLVHGDDEGDAAMDCEADICTIPEPVPHRPDPAPQGGVSVPPLSPPLAVGGSGDYLLLMFPNLEAPSMPLERAALKAPNIYLLYASFNGALFVWLPSRGQLFIPSKYDGDKEAFCTDIARGFLAARGLPVKSLHLETAGKESPAFLHAFQE